MQPEGQLMIYAHGAEIELSVAVAAAQCSLSSCR